jgi:hypothetical protein
MNRWLIPVPIQGGDAPRTLRHGIGRRTSDRAGVAKGISGQETFPDNEPAPHAGSGIHSGQLFKQPFYRHLLLVLPP